MRRGRGQTQPVQTHSGDSASASASPEAGRVADCDIDFTISEPEIMHDIVQRDELACSGEPFWFGLGPGLGLGLRLA